MLKLGPALLLIALTGKALAEAAKLRNADPVDIRLRRLVDVADRATSETPHQFAVGVKHVFVNGTQVLKDGEHTGPKPGGRSTGRGKKK